MSRDEAADPAAQAVPCAHGNRLSSCAGVGYTAAPAWNAAFQGSRHRVGWDPALRGVAMTFKLPLAQAFETIP